jgi:arylsulfatase A-like enzyme
MAPPDAMRGRPLQTLVSDGDTDWRDEVFLQISESQCGRAIRTKRWKYSVRAPDKSGRAPASDVYVEDYLYDLEADPFERDNLVADPDLGEVRETLARTLKRHILEAEGLEPQILSQAEYGGSPVQE